MKLSNPFMKLVVLVDDKKFEVMHVASSIDEANDFCRKYSNCGIISSVGDKHIVASFDPTDGSDLGWADPGFNKRKIATKVEGLHPRIVWTDPESGLTWLMFEYDGTFSAYKDMPQFLKYNNEHFIKTGHNSDTNNISYRRMNDPAQIATEIKA